VGLRKDVKNAMLAAMATITTTNGYNRTVSHVSEGWRSMSDVPEAQCPAIFLIGFVINHRPTTVYRKALVGHALFRVIEKGQDALDNICDLEEDIENCILNNRHWDQESALNTELINTTRHPFKDEAWSDIECELFWTETRT